MKRGMLNHLSPLFTSSSSSNPYPSYVGALFSHRHKILKFNKLVLRKDHTRIAFLGHFYPKRRILWDNDNFHNDLQVKLKLLQIVLNDNYICWFGNFMSPFNMHPNPLVPKSLIGNVSFKNILNILINTKNILKLAYLFFALGLWGPYTLRSHGDLRHWFSKLLFTGDPTTIPNRNSIPNTNCPS